MFKSVAKNADDLEKMQRKTLDNLVNFSMESARCYDPNESKRLKNVIAAVGISAFEKKIRVLGTELLERNYKEKTSFFA